MPVLFESEYKLGEFKSLDLSLDRIKNALNGLDLSSIGRVIHVAGTNGKGSTSYFISQLLEQLGYKTALFTSPHIRKINERIKIRLNDIDDEVFNSFYIKNRNIIEKFKLTYFEALTLIAFDIFSKYCPDYTILETGLGGRFDATNVVDHKTAVITSISQDHADILGKDIYSIIEEKRAIIKDNTPFFLGINSLFIQKYFENKYGAANIISPDITDIKKFEEIFPYPYYENLSLAYTVVSNMTGYKFDYFNFSVIKMPECRFEKVGNIIFDGSHNPAGLRKVLKNSINGAAVVFSSTKERPVKRMLDIISTVSNKIFITEIPDNDRSIDIDNLDISSFANVKKIKDPIAALKEASSDNCLVLVTGSYYLCSYIKNIMG